MSQPQRARTLTDIHDIVLEPSPIVLPQRAVGRSPGVAGQVQGAAGEGAVLAVPAVFPLQALQGLAQPLRAVDAVVAVVAVGAAQPQGPQPILPQVPRLARGQVSPDQLAGTEPD